MADRDKMSVEEILAAARRQDGSGASESTPAPAEPEATEPETTGSEATGSEVSGPEAGGESAAPAEPAKPAKKPGQMSVEEMLAAARGEKSGAAPAKPAAASGGGAAEAAKPAKKPGQMSVEEMLAAARGETSKPAAPKAKPKAAPAAAKAKPAATKAPAAPAASGPKDTGSILAAARKSAKPGPLSKAEAAAQARVAESKPAAKAKPTVPPMPERPAYAQRPRSAAATAADDGDTRRGFFAAATGVLFGSSLALGFTSLALTHVLWLLGLARYMFPNVLTEPPTKFKVGFPDTYAPGQVETKYKAQFGVWVVRFEYEGQQQIYALKSVCTHLGCTPNWLEGEQKFKCPCHGSGFYKDGVNFEGPAPRPLERYAIRLSDDGQLEVDKSATFQQELGQWGDPASYYAV